MKKFEPYRDIQELDAKELFLLARDLKYYQIRKSIVKSINLYDIVVYPEDIEILADAFKSSVFYISTCTIHEAIEMCRKKKSD